MANETGTFYPAQGSVHGYGTQVLLGDVGSPENFEALAEVRSVEPGAIQTATYPRTHLRSPEAHEELAPAMRSSGPFIVTMNYRPQHMSQSYAGGGTGPFQDGGLLKLSTTREIRNWLILYADGSPATEYPFEGFVSNYKPGTVNIEGGPDLVVEITPINGAWHADLP